MSTKYRTHPIKKGDTIQSLAIELGITPDEVRGFHNTCCKNEDTIGFELPTHLVQLFVYPHIREIKKENYPTATFESGYNLRANPKKDKVNYGVTYTITDNTIVNKISYTLSLECKQTSNGHFLYEINKFETYINNLDPEILADELAEKVARVLYPLKVIINPEGKFIGIHNFEEINKRWKKEKEKLLEYYQGDWANKYLDLTETTLQSESSLQRALSGDWFLSSFFAGIYTNYTRYYKFQNKVDFPILANTKPLVYKVEQTTDEYLDEHLQLVIEQNGILDDERAKIDIENGLYFPDYALQNPQAEKAQGEFRSKYFLNPKDNTIKSLFLRCSVIFDNPKTIEVVVSLID
jgi:hypothetical protein